jgi:hypothetical protein
MSNVLSDLKSTKPLIIALIVILTIGAILLLRKVGGMPVVYARKVPILGGVFTLAVAFLGALLSRGGVVALAVFILPFLLTGRGVL